jgi:hypothetical protein
MVMTKQVNFSQNVKLLHPNASFQAEIAVMRVIHMQRAVLIYTSPGNTTLTRIGYPRVTLTIVMNSCTFCFNMLIQGPHEFTNTKLLHMLHVTKHTHDHDLLYKDTLK